MADKGRILAGHAGGSETITSHKKKKEPINIIFMRKVGRIYSADVSGRYLFLLAVFAVVFAVLSVMVINRFADLYFENQRLQRQVTRMTRTLDKREFQSQVVNQYHLLASELNKTDQKKQPQAPGAGKVSASAPALVPTEPEEPAGAAEPTQKTSPETPENPPVDAENLYLRAESGGRALRFRFHLRNIHPGNKTVTGYLFAILTNPGTSPATRAVYPEVELKDGEPVNYRRGIQFSIRHGKMVQGRISGITQASGFTEAHVCAYSEDGGLMMKKRLTLEDG